MVQAVIIFFKQKMRHEIQREYLPVMGMAGELQIAVELFVEFKRRVRHPVGGKMPVSTIPGIFFKICRRMEQKNPGMIVGRLWGGVFGIVFRQVGDIIKTVDSRIADPHNFKSVNVDQLVVQNPEFGFFDDIQGLFNAYIMFVIAGDKKYALLCPEPVERFDEFFIIPVYPVKQITRDQDEIRVKAVDLGNDSLGKRFSVNVSQMNVGKLNQFGLLPAWGKIFKPDSHFPNTGMKCAPEAVGGVCCCQGQHNGGDSLV